MPLILRLIPFHRDRFQGVAWKSIRQAQGQKSADREIWNKNEDWWNVKGYACAPERDNAQASVQVWSSRLFLSFFTEKRLR